MLLTETLRLLHQVQLEDLPLVVESLIENFQEDIVPVAELIVEELVCFSSMPISLTALSRFRSKFSTT